MYPNPLHDDSPTCFFAEHGFMENGDPVPPCEGRLVRCHLIEKQELERLDLYPWDEATWVWGCGGHNYGNEGHHGLFDNYKLHIRFRDVPAATTAFAARHKLQRRLRRFK